MQFDHIRRLIVNRFPGRDELYAYFRHLNRVWGLGKDCTFNSRITNMRWNKQKSCWDCEVNGGESTFSTWSVVLCTGFASKPYTPPYKGMDDFKGYKVHTSKWPQSGFSLDDQKVAIIGTGASGVQAIQEVASVASQLTVFQRTPNTALPMTNPNQTAAMNKTMRTGFLDTAEKMKET